MGRSTPVRVVGYTIRQLPIESLEHLTVLPSLYHSNPQDFEQLKTLNVVFGAYHGPLLVGVGGLACYDGQWCLRLGLVAPQHRGRGLQKALIQARLHWLKKHGVHDVSVWIEPTNTSSLNNVVDAGFRFTQEPPKEFHGRLHLKLQNKT